MRRNTSMVTESRKAVGDDLATAGSQPSSFWLRAIPVA
jgi:hypothetical protein